MQRRKQSLLRNATEVTQTKSHRLPRVVRTATADKKANDLITSAKKQKAAAGTLANQKSIRKVNLSTEDDLINSPNKVISLVSMTPVIDKKGVDEEQCTRSTIFSPSYHPKDGDDDRLLKGEYHGDGTFVSKHVIKDDHNLSIDERRDASSQCEQNRDTSCSDSSCQDFNRPNSRACSINIESTAGNSFLVDDEFSALGNLSPEVSAIYYAMQNSKLECIDEQSQDSVSTEECAESDESDKFDDFDPYLFIKDLPDLSLVVPKFRPMLLPKQTRSCPSTTLVLDLDETLVHSTLEPNGGADFTFPVNFNLKEHTIYVRCRPYLKVFLERVCSLFETIIFTASQSIYAEQLLSILDPKRKLFRHRVYRDSCVYVDGNYLKDLSVLGRDLARVVIVDNSPQAFGFQLNNGVPIESWFEDPNDQELLALLPFLESLVGVEDVRPHIARKFNLQARVASAAPLPIDLKE